MKAFLTKDGSISIFCPDRNAARFANLLKRLKITAFSKEMYVTEKIEYVHRNEELDYIPHIILKEIKTITTNPIHTTQNEIKWIQCASNYVISAHAKKKADYMKVVFFNTFK